MRLGGPLVAQQVEIVRALTRFFRQAGDAPSMLWSHTVCWTDRAIRRHVFGGNLVSTPLRIRTLREWGKAKLRFEYNRHIGINVGDISWLEPEAGGEPTPLVKTISLRQSLIGGRPVASGYRESVGRCVDPRTDRRWLRRSLFPGLSPNLYSLLEDGAGRAVSVAPAADAGGEAVPTEDGRVVDPQGILNAQVLKGWRLAEVAVSPGERTVMVDELAFVFDPAGLLAYVASTWDRFAQYVPPTGDDNWLGEWLSSRR